MATLSDIQWTLLREILVSCTHEGNTDMMKSLHFVLGDHTKLLDSTLEIIEKHEARTSIICFVHNGSGREIFKVLCSHDSHYYCIGSLCTCQSYASCSKGNREHVVCKHLLAVNITHSLKTCTTQCVSTEEFGHMLIEMMVAADSTAPP